MCTNTRISAQTKARRELYRLHLPVSKYRHEHTYKCAYVRMKHVYIHLELSIYLYPHIRHYIAWLRAYLRVYLNTPTQISSMRKGKIMRIAKYAHTYMYILYITAPIPQHARSWTCPCGYTDVVPRLCDQFCSDTHPRCVYSPLDAHFDTFAWIKGIFEARFPR